MTNEAGWTTLDSDVLCVIWSMPGFANKNPRRYTRKAMLIKFVINFV